MKIVLLRGEDCGDRITCPHVFGTDRGTYVVQGVVSADLACSAGQAVVEVPLRLVPEVVAHRNDDVWLTDRDSVLVRGATLTDEEALAAIRQGADEGVVEVAEGVLPGLEVSR